MEHINYLIMQIRSQDKAKKWNDGVMMLIIEVKGKKWNDGVMKLIMEDPIERSYKGYKK